MTSRGRPVGDLTCGPTIRTLAWLRQLDTDAGMASYPLELPSPGPDQPGVYVPDYVDLEDQQSWRESGGRVCRRCGMGVPLMTAGDPELCPCGGQLL